MMKSRRHQVQRLTLIITDQLSLSATVRDEISKQETSAAEARTAEASHQDVWDCVKKKKTPTLPAKPKHKGAGKFIGEVQFRCPCQNQMRQGTTCDRTSRDSATDNRESNVDISHTYCIAHCHLHSPCAANLQWRYPLRHRIPNKSTACNLCRC